MSAGWRWCTPIPTTRPAARRLTRPTSARGCWSGTSTDGEAQQRDITLSGA
jgi:hypothetical protein